MPPRKRSHTIKEKSKKGYEACGSGSQSRIGLDFDKLREASWRIMHFLSCFLLASGSPLDCEQSLSSPNFWSAHLAHDGSSERRSRIILLSLFVRDMRGKSTTA